MKKFFSQTLIVTLLGMGSCSGAAADEVGTAKAVARKDYDSAIAKIAADDKAAQQECEKTSGPAAQACHIQTQAKREEAEEEAKMTRDRAGRVFPLPNKDQKKAGKDALTRAKVDFSVAEARIRATDQAAVAACEKARADEISACKKDVAARTKDARKRAQSRYQRAVADAKAIAVP